MMTRWAEVTALAGEGDQVFMAAVVAADTAVIVGQTGIARGVWRKRVLHDTPAADVLCVRCAGELWIKDRGKKGAFQTFPNSMPHSI
jgi:hypothetical protein